MGEEYTLYAHIKHHRHLPNLSLGDKEINYRTVATYFQIKYLLDFFQI
jgi:hypothetical protein